MKLKLTTLLAFGLIATWITPSVFGQEAKPAAAEPAATPDVLYIDRMSNVSKNDIGGRNSVYVQAPSRVSFSKAAEYGKEAGSNGLKITYDKKNEGGPRGDGGFCGFYTIVKKGPNQYLDGSAYNYLTFWVKGEKGTEKFKLGTADKMWEAMDDSVKSQEIGSYLPAGKITTDWQLAVIPTSELFIDWKQVNSFSVCFESDCFENGAGQGTLYIADLALMKNKPVK